MVTNHPEHDPDIQLMPFFAFNTKFFNSLYSTFHDCIMFYDAPARFLLEYQHLTFYPMMLVARFSLVGKSYYYLAMKAKPDAFRTYEVVGIVVWWCWFSKLLAHMGSGLDGWINRVMFVFIMLAAVCPIHVQIVLSHSAQDSTDMGVYESFVARQFRTTMDIACPPYLDFIHGGLHMQLVHHVSFGVSAALELGANLSSAFPRSSSPVFLAPTSVALPSSSRSGPRRTTSSSWRRTSPRAEDRCSTCSRILPVRRGPLTPRLPSWPRASARWRFEAVQKLA